MDVQYGATTFFNIINTAETIARNPSLNLIEIAANNGLILSKMTADEIDMLLKLTEEYAKIYY